jgi:hypothetical protein
MLVQDMSLIVAEKFGEMSWNFRSQKAKQYKVNDEGKNEFTTGLFCEKPIICVGMLHHKRIHHLINLIPAFSRRANS